MMNARIALPLLALAVGTAGCKTVPEASNEPMTSQSKSVTETTIRTLPASTAVAVLHTDIARGTLVVELNGTQVGKVGPHQELNIAKYVRPGRNTMTVRWTKPVVASGQVTVGGVNAAVSQAAHFSLTRTQTARPGEYRVSFETPGIR